MKFHVFGRLKRGEEKTMISIFSDFYHVGSIKQNNLTSVMYTLHSYGIDKVGNLFHPTLHFSVRSRAYWNANICQQQGCQMVFILKNVSKSDQTTYGCTIVVWGVHVRNGPVNLVVTGKCTRRMMS